MKNKEFSDWVTGSNTTYPFPKFTTDVPAQRRCKGKRGCAASSVFTYAKIAAAEDAKDLSLEALNDDEYVIARMAVRRPDPGEDELPDELRYGLSGRNVTYYMIVQKAPNPGPVGQKVGKWLLVEVDADGYHQPVDSGVFKRCCKKDEPQHCVKSPFSYAGFEECTADHGAYVALFRAINTDTTRTKRDSAMATLMTLAKPDAPAWVTCAHGCCIASY